MILDEFVYVGLSPRNVSYYEKLGYTIPRKTDKKGRVNYTKGTKIKVNVCDLMPTSKVKVLCRCELCGKERYIFYDSLAKRVGSFFFKPARLCASNAETTHLPGKTILNISTETAGIVNIETTQKEEVSHSS